MNAVDQPPGGPPNSTLKRHGDSARFEQLLAEEEASRESLLEEELAIDNDAMMWSSERVRKWLVEVGLDELYGNCFLFLSFLV